MTDWKVLTHLSERVILGSGTDVAVQGRQAAVRQKRMFRSAIDEIAERKIVIAK